MLNQKLFFCLHKNCLKIQKENSVLLYDQEKILKHEHFASEFIIELPSGQTVVRLCQELDCKKFFFSTEALNTHYLQNHALGGDKRNLGSDYLRRISEFLWSKKVLNCFIFLIFLDLLACFYIQNFFNF